MASKYDNLKNSFGVSVRPLLTSCSREDVDRAFPTLSDSQKDAMHRMFIQVVKSLHQSIEVEFESICQEVQVSDALDIVEQQIEEQNMDILSRYKNDSSDVKKQLSDVKKDELNHLLALAKQERHRLSLRSLLDNVEMSIKN